MYKGGAILVGVFIAIMVAFNGTLALLIGQFQSTVIIHFVGLLTISVILIIRREKLKLNKGLPFYLFTGGSIGFFVVFFNNIAFNNIGASLTLSLGLFGQLIASVIIDNYGLFHREIDRFKKEKLLGFFLILVGLVIMVIY